MNMFRPAPDASTARHIAATLAQTTVFWSVFLFVLPELIAAIERSLAIPTIGFAHHRTVGVLLFAAAGSLGLTSGLTMAIHGRGTPLPLATARRFVAIGPYRFVRNPMAIAGISQGVAVGIFRGSAAVVAYALVGAVLWHRVARPPEERDLEARFGAPYRRYRDAVPLWWPRWPRPDDDDEAAGGRVGR